jgi:ABC transport system ATP-binding/permease protein
MSNIKISISFSGNSKNYAFPIGTSTTLGRNGDITLAVDSISGQHLKIGNENGRLWIEDLGSTNGTAVNGKKIVPNTKIFIHQNDIIEPAPGSGASIVLANSEQANKPITQSEQNIQSLNKLLETKSSILIGRSSECDVVLNDTAVSRKHARVFKVNHEIFVEDLQSTNGTFINQTRIKKATQLTETDKLLIGLNVFKINEKPRVLSKESAITASQVSKIFENGYKGLQTTSLEIPYKQMVALMGPSGCGKSTLMKVLNGDMPPSKGQIKLFGLDLYENFEFLKQIIGYVPQDNIVHNELTVEDSLYYSAKLRLSPDVSQKEINRIISEVLGYLNIDTPQIRKTKIGKLSGGQRKRVSIATELLTKPKILFLDEPTSPLDPETIEEFLKCLRNLCNEGTTVVMVTHKPEDLNYVDRVIFMGTQGHLVFDGEKNMLLQYFNKKTIIEIYALLGNPENSKQWYSKWNTRDNTNSQEHKDFEPKFVAAGAMHQFRWLSQRYLKIKLSNAKNLMLIFFQPILISVLIISVFDSLYEEDVFGAIGNTGILFLMAIAAIWFGVSNAAKEFVSEKAIFKRERMFNLTIKPYIFSKLSVLSLISVVQIVIFLAILFGYYSELNSFGLATCYMMLISITSIQFGLLLSAFSKTSEEVMSILPVALMPQIILAGILQPIQNEFTKLLSYLTIGRWGTEGLARIQDKDDADKPFVSMIEQHLYKDNTGSFLNEFESNVIALMILTVIMFVLVDYLLKKQTKIG